jgi:nucleoid DNA-binding protein
MNITRQDLVDMVSEELPDLDPELIAEIIKLLLENIIIEISKGNKIEFRNFGRFKIKYKKGRIAHNPKTMEKVKVPPKKVCVFKEGKKFKEEIERVNLNPNQKIDISKITSKFRDFNK